MRGRYSLINWYIVFYTIIVIFSCLDTPIFAKDGAGRGRFARHLRGVAKKKFCFFIAVLQRVRMEGAKKVKKIFGGLENVRIFAPAFERGVRPRGAP